MMDRDMLRAGVVGKIKGIAKGLSVPDDANQAMLHICDALSKYELERAESYEAEDGPFASTFATYAEEARVEAEDMAKARLRWEVSNVPELLQSVICLLGHLQDQMTGSQREYIYAAGRAILAAQDLQDRKAAA